MVSIIQSFAYFFYLQHVLQECFANTIHNKNQLRELGISIDPSFGFIPQNQISQDHRDLSLPKYKRKYTSRGSFREFGHPPTTLGFELSSELTSSYNDHAEQSVLGGEKNYVSDISICGLKRSVMSRHESSSSNQSKSIPPSAQTKELQHVHDSYIQRSLDEYKTIFVTWDVYRKCNLHSQNFRNLEYLYVSIPNTWQSIFESKLMNESTIISNFFPHSKLKNVDIVDKSGNTLLMYSLVKGSSKLFRTSLIYSPSINTTNDQKMNALHFAILHRREQMALELLNMGIDYNQPDVDGFTPLMISVNCSSLFWIKKLASKKDINFNAFDNIHQTTALMKAAELNRLDVIQILADAGADIDVSVIPGKDAIYYAAKSNNIDAIRLIQYLGFKSSNRLHKKKFRSRVVPGFLAYKKKEKLD